MHPSGIEPGGGKPIEHFASSGAAGRTRIGPGSNRHDRCDGLLDVSLVASGGCRTDDYAAGFDETGDSSKGRLQIIATQRHYRSVKRILLG
jgi:hypothetical protein